MRFIKLTLKKHEIVHGFNPDNKEIIAKVEMPESVVKYIATDRIQSIGEKFIKTLYAFGGVVYWEYEEPMAEILEKLYHAVLILD